MTQMTTSTRRQIRFNDLKPSDDLDRILRESYYRVMSSGRYIGGKEVREFEEAWATYCGVRNCVSCASGFDAIQLAVRANLIEGHASVIAPHLTCVPTWQAAEVAGGDVHGADVLPTYNMEPASYKHYHIILPVHLYGQPADLVTLREKNKGKIIIADGAQAHGSMINDQPVAKFADATIFSFYPTKNLGAYGDAGAIVTDDDSLAWMLRDLREFKVSLRSISSRMDPLQAAFLRDKLEAGYLHYANEIRRTHAEIYLQQLKGYPIDLPVVPDWAGPNWHQFVVRHPERDVIRRSLYKRGIETLIHYPTLPVMRYFIQHLEVKGTLASKMVREIFSLPIAEHLSSADILYVCENLKEILEVL